MGHGVPLKAIGIQPAFHQSRQIRRSSGSRDGILRHGWFAASTPHQPIEGGKIGPSAPLRKKFARTHGGQLFGHSSRDELIDARAILLCAAFYLRLDRAWQAKRVGALVLYVLILRIASAGVSRSIPNRAGATPKSRRLNVTIAAAWDAETGAQLALLKSDTDEVYSAAWSPDGTRIVAASADDARVWDVKTGAQLTLLQGHTAQVYGAAWSPDGARIVTASADDTARVWDAKTGAQLVLLRSHTDRVYSATWSPDGTRLVTASADDTARVWDAGTGAQLALLQGHMADVNLARWSPDGMRIVTASADDTARVWDAGTHTRTV